MRSWQEILGRSGTGAAGGAMAGSAAGPWGAAIGGIGGALSGALSGLMGTDESGTSTKRRSRMLPDESIDMALQRYLKG